MKYVRKIVALLIAVFLIAAIAIGMGVIFSVRNVNVTLLSYSYEAEDEQAKAKISEFKGEILGEVRGRIISTVSEKKVAEAITDGKFTVESCKKSYPCTLNVTIKERREVFAVDNKDGSYSLYDEEGLFLRTAPSFAAAVNPDGSPNLFVEGAKSEDLKDIAKACAIFKAEFSSLRSVVEKVVLSKENVLTFNLRCGLDVKLSDYTVLTSQKIEAAYDCFISLDSESKLDGEIYCYAIDGGVNAVYHDIK